MKYNPKKRLILLLSIFVVLVIISGLAYRFLPDKTQSPKDVCLSNNLEWLEEFDECEGMGEIDCIALGGQWFECGSACRHDPDAQYCILSCVAYCKF